MTAVLIIICIFFLVAGILAVLALRHDKKTEVHSLTVQLESEKKLHDKIVKETTEMYEKMMTDIREKFFKAQADADLYRIRMEQVEDKVSAGYNIPIREIKNIVNSDFDKFELVCMMAGIGKLINNSKSVDDMEIYIKLIKKIQGVVDIIPEEEKKNGI